MSRRRPLLVLAAGILVMIAPLLVLRASATRSSKAVAEQGRVVAAAGDIACDPRQRTFDGRDSHRCQQRAVSDLLLQRAPYAVLALGDIQYKSGVPAAFARSYKPSWGRLLSITRPVPGNHDYGTADAEGYYGFFGARAGGPTEGWYSFNVGAWHVIALNGECRKIGGCRRGSPEERWLRADLNAHPARCTLAFWHEPRFSSGIHGNNPTYQPFWQALYGARAEVVLNGHDHDYERFAPQTPTGLADPHRGIREFVVGTGGESAYKFRTIRANSEVRETGTFGALFLTLGATGYEWTFTSAAGKAFTDSGSGTCH